MRAAWRADFSRLLIATLAPLAERNSSNRRRGDTAPKTPLDYEPQNEMSRHRTLQALALRRRELLPLDCDDHQQPPCTPALRPQPARTEPCNLRLPAFA